MYLKSFQFIPRPNCSNNSSVRIQTTTQAMAMSSAKPQNRFPACDRCRMQKLKCPRTDKEQSESCIRCSHAQVQCVTSNRRHPGRPPAHTRVTGNAQVSRSGARRLNSHTVHSYDDDENYQLQSDDSHLLLDDILSCENDLDYFSTHDGTSTFDIAALIDPSMGQTLFSPVAPPNGPREQAQAIGAQVHHGQYQSDNDQTEDPQIGLAFLQYKLLRKLAQFKALDWDIPKSLSLKCHCLASSGPAPATSDPLSEVFELMAELESALTHMRHSDSSGLLEEPRDSSVTSILPAISCYLHVRSLYDYLFSQILYQSSKDPSVKDFILNSPLPLYMAGVMVPSPVKNMVGLSFVQIMRAKIQPMEEELGIPLQLRISEEATVEAQSRPVKLLSKEQTNGLLKILQEPDVAQHELEGHSCTSNSINDKIRQIVALG